MTELTPRILLAVSGFLASFFFAGAEIGLVSCDRIRLRYLSERGSRRARLLLRLLIHPDRLLAVTLVGTNLASVLCSAMVTSLSISLWGIEGTKVAIPVFIVFYIIFAEILPKALFRLRADALVLWSVYPLAAAYAVLRPMTILFQSVSRALMRLIRVADKERPPRLTREELAHFLERSGHMGGAGRRWFRAVLGISERTVASVVVPIGDIPAVAGTEPAEAAAARLREAGASFVLVTRGVPDEPFGTVDVHDLLDAPPERAVGELARSAPVVPADMRIEDLLPEIQRGATPLAFVAREGGGVAGIVTHESIAFAIVGAIDEAPAAIR